MTDSINERIYDALMAAGQRALADEFSDRDRNILSVIAVTQEEMWMYLDCDQCGKRLCEIEANDTLDVLVAVARDHLETCDGPRFTQVNQPILIYAFHTPDEGGGFDWGPDTEENRAVLAQAMSHDLAHANYTTGVLVSLSIAPYESPEQVTEYIEGELQDAVEVGAVGHIIGRFNLSSIDDSPCLALGRHYMWQRHSRAQCPAERENQ